MVTCVIIEVKAPLLEIIGVLVPLLNGAILLNEAEIGWCVGPNGSVIFAFTLTLTIDCER